MVKKDNMPIERDSYSVKEYAKLKGVHINTVYKWIDNGEITPDKLWRMGRTIRILK